MIRDVVKENKDEKDKSGNDKRIDNAVEEKKGEKDDKKDKDDSKKSPFKFEDEEDDEWDALPPFLRRKK
jgi:hypothetical protein